MAISRDGHVQRIHVRLRPRQRTRHAATQQGGFEEELGVDTDRFRAEEEPAVTEELTPLEKVTMLSYTVLNSTFCILQTASEPWKG